MDTGPAMVHFLLMCRQFPVLEFERESPNGAVTKIGNTLDSESLPLDFIRQGRNLLSRKALDHWWRHRAIPHTRDHIGTVLQEQGLTSTSDFLRNSYGLSLSDQYWVKPANGLATWKPVNFFHRDFDEGLGTLLLTDGSSSSSAPLTLPRNSPDATSGGDLPKRWEIENEQRVLIKGARTGQEPYNEVIAHRLCKLLGIVSVPYQAGARQNILVSSCPEMLTDTEELIPAYSIVTAFKKDNQASEYTHWIHSAMRLGASETAISHATDDWLLVDYLMRNVDRHWNNFGLIRDVETLEVRPAPIFDTGDSLWNGLISLSNVDYQTKPFFPRSEKNSLRHLRLLRDWSRFDLDKLAALPDLAAEILHESPLLREDRIARITELLRERVQRVKLEKASA
jgi:hypothetical protein